MVTLHTWQRRWFQWGLLPFAILISACSPRHLIVQGLAAELAHQGQAPEDDLILAREASGFYLKLSESLLRETPGNLPLAEAVAGGFTQYAYAFVQFEAERVESQNAHAAQKLRARAAGLYRRAHLHAMQALEHQTPGFRKALATPGATQSLRLTPEQVGIAYWAAASWGGFIALSKDDPDTVADLPLAIRLAQLAFAVSPEHGSGALVSLMGSFEAARPGGSAAQAGNYFDQAIGLSGANNAGPFVAKAEAIALPAGDRAAFDALLRQALTISAAHRNLQNGVMRERANWLLENANDLF